MESILKKLLESAKKEISEAKDPEHLRNLEIKYLGRKGEFTILFQDISKLPQEERPKMGQLCNAIKKELETLFSDKKSEFENEQTKKNLEINFFDTSIPGIKYDIGHIHPLSQVQRDVENIFSQMGFQIADGPEVESEYYNFEGLNIPVDHPARDMQDTFFLKDKHHEKHGRMVLRTHTSPVQIRSMEKYGAPLQIIIPGRVFRYEATDASHDTTFYQVEGLMIDADISLAHLKGVMKEFLTRLFQREMKVRFRPGYFPFVEPGIELDMSCIFCNASQSDNLTKKIGCHICKHTGFIEFMGAGMVHPNVLKAGKIDSAKYQGWAFGFGLTRLVMMKFGIDDIRLLTSGDLRFLTQF